MSLSTRLTHHFADHLPSLCRPAEGHHFPKAKLLLTNQALAEELGLSDDDLKEFQDAPAFLSQSGHALGYSGHQFGSFNPSLGDGRALLLGEIDIANSDSEADLRDIHLKGSGRTPYSNPGADGMLPLGAAFRELIISEFLHAVGIPTSRVLAVFATGEKLAMPRNKVGNPFPPGAVIIRVARHHIRIGTFQHAALHGPELTDELLAYTLARNGIASTGSRTEDAVALFSWVSQAQAQLVAQWMRIGFVHGVLNTDNVSLAGESIDFGPCAFLDRYHVDAVFSSIDAQGRYAFSNQPPITQWNLARFAESLLPLWTLDGQDAATRGVEELSAVLENFPKDFDLARTAQMSQALGSDWQEVLASFDSHTDYAAELHARNPANPPIIPRNIPVQHALTAAEEGNLDDVLELFSVVQDPFAANTEEKTGLARAADQTGFTSYCGT